jgi:Cu/Ag efflux protein CusF
VISLKKAIAVVISVLFVLSFAGPTFARMGMKRAIGDSPVKDAQGEIQAIDQKAKTITVKAMRGPLTATADEKTVVKLGKEMKAFSDLKVGDKVVVTYEAGEGKNIAKTIVISPPVVAPVEKKDEPKKPEEKK